MVFVFFAISAVLFLGIAGLSLVWPPVVWSFVVLVPVFLEGIQKTDGE